MDRILDAILVGISAGAFWSHLFMFHWKDIKDFFKGKGK